MAFHGTRAILNAASVTRSKSADGSVRAALQHLAETDQNQYIRSQARTVLAQLPEID